MKIKIHGLFCKLVISALFFITLPSSVYGQWLTGYNNRIKITILSSEISGITSHLDFPVLVNTTMPELRDYANGGYVANANGWDIVFSEDHISILDHQIESYDNATGELVAWVRIPELSPGSNYEFYIYFGSIWLDSDLSAESTWSEDYVSVYHLHDGLEDATSSGNDGTNNGSFNGTGKIADAREFNGSSHYIDLGNPSEFNFSTSDWTVSAWINTTDNFQNNIFSNGGDDQGGIRYVLASSETGSAGTAVLTTDDNDDKYQAISSSGLTNNGQWHYVVGKREGNRIYIYHDNGGPEDVTTIRAGYNLSGTSQKNALIGAGISQQYGTIIKYFDGLIDEVRVQKVARSNGWIQTEYANQNSPSTFCQFGSLEIPNDDPCGAISLVVENQCGENTIYATNEPATSGSQNPGCFWNSGTDSDVWFRFTIPSSGQVKVEGIESTLVDGAMAFYSGTDCNDLTYIDCVDTGPGMETFLVSGNPGDKIWVQFWGYDGETGRFGICVTDFPPIPDESCDAVLLPVNRTCIPSTFDNTYATATTSVPDPDYCAGIGRDSYRTDPSMWQSHDLWFKFIVPASGEVTIEGIDIGGLDDGVMAVYRGVCSSLTLIACDDDFKGPGGMPYLSLNGQVPGDTLWIRFWGYINEAGSFDICVHDPSCSDITVDAGADRLICAGETISLGGEPTATGWTGNVTYLWTPATGLDDPASANPVTTVNSNTIYTVYVSDETGCYASDIVNISIKDDDSDPDVKSPEDQSVSTNYDCNYQVAGTEFDLVSAIDNCVLVDTTYQLSGATIIAETSSGSLQGVILTTGITTITWRVYDGLGNYGQSSFTVTVGDLEDPVVTSCPGDIVVSNDPGACNAMVNYAVPVFEDNCDGTGLSGTRTEGPASGSTFPIGETTVTYRFTDAGGNGPVECTFTVTVNDDEDPEIICASPAASYSTNEGECYFTVPDNGLDPVLADDNCSVASVLNDFNGSSTLNGAQFPVGITPVIWTITDVNGRTNNCQYDIEVIDNQDPVITCASPEASYNADPGECFYTVPGTSLDPVLTDDDCGIASVENSFNGLSSLVGAEFP
ncbi:MAG: DUF2341 domain-containing protein, partial [Bacteroidales bacterium]|nr:DUF2341 domain-containing protein [Bacteroidales bacterium]